jgi:hypothetical protein
MTKYINVASLEALVERVQVNITSEDCAAFAEELSDLLSTAVEGVVISRETAELVLIWVEVKPNRLNPPAHLQEAVAAELRVALKEQA